MKYRNNIVAFVCGVMTFLFFSFQFIENELYTFPNAGYAAANSILFCSMVGAYLWAVRRIKIPRNKVFVILAWLLSAFFSLMAVLGKYYVPIRTEKIDDVTDEEMETIQRVMRLDKEEYKKLYYPYNFDKIKRKFNNKASREEIRDFLKVWVKLFFRHPDTYVGAVVSQNCFLFSPFLDNCRYYYSASAHILRNNKDFHDMYLNHFHNETWRRLQLKLQDEYYRYFTQVPVLGLFVNQGWYSLLLLGISVSALCQKNKKMFFLSLPFLLTLAIIFVGPAVSRHQRYMFPIMFSMPLLFGQFLIRKKEE